MASNWWFYPNGLNALGGLDTWDDEELVWVKDTNNPAILPRETIITLLRMIPAARLAFNVLYPTMTDDEKVRLDEISVIAKFMVRSPKEIEDDFQSKWNKAGIYTTGPRGGGN